MKFVLEIAMDNEAFEDPAELPRVVGGVAETLSAIANLGGSGSNDGRVRDVNGNTVGVWSVTA